MKDNLIISEKIVKTTHPRNRFIAGSQIAFSYSKTIVKFDFFEFQIGYHKQKSFV